MAGWVYIITNKAMPGILKIGYTERNPYIRAYELYNTGVPYAYDLNYSTYVSHPYDVEQTTHFLQQKANVGKEWFNCNQYNAIKSIEKAINICSNNIEGFSFDPTKKPSLILTEEERNDLLARNPETSELFKPKVNNTNQSNIRFNYNSKKEENSVSNINKIAHSQDIKNIAKEPFVLKIENNNFNLIAFNNISYIIGNKINIVILAEKEINREYYLITAILAFEDGTFSKPFNFDIKSKSLFDRQRLNQRFINYLSYKYELISEKNYDFSIFSSIHSVVTKCIIISQKNQSIMKFGISRVNGKPWLLTAEQLKIIREIQNGLEPTSSTGKLKSNTIQQETKNKNISCIETKDNEPFNQKNKNNTQTNVIIQQKECVLPDKVDNHHTELLKDNKISETNNISNQRIIKNTFNNTEKTKEEQTKQTKTYNPKIYTDINNKIIYFKYSYQKNSFEEKLSKIQESYKQKLKKLEDETNAFNQKNEIEEDNKTHKNIRDNSIITFVISLTIISLVICKMAGLHLFSFITSLAISFFIARCYYSHAIKDNKINKEVLKYRYGIINQLPEGKSIKTIDDEIKIFKNERDKEISYLIFDYLNLKAPITVVDKH